MPAPESNQRSEIVVAVHAAASPTEVDQRTAHIMSSICHVEGGLLAECGGTVWIHCCARFTMCVYIVGRTSACVYIQRAHALAALHEKHYGAGAFF